MSCCNTNITPFSNESVTTLSYTGQRPTVDVAYLEPDNTFSTSGKFTQVQITASQVIIDHGGPSSGYVKILQ